MQNEPDELGTPSVEQVDAALESFWQGSYEQFDRLIDGAEHNSQSENAGVCALLGELVDLPRIASRVPGRIGDYEILRILGAGGMATVYEARQPRTGQTVALKVLHRFAADARPDRLLRREVESLARLKHPYIAQLYDAGVTEDGQHYFAMERAEGLPLSALLRADAKGKPPPWDTLQDRLTLFAKICAGISYAHQRGVIHCDLKPANILVAEEGTTAHRHEGTEGADSGTFIRANPKILDFGLSRLIDADGTLMTRMTDAGRLAGTLAYMSPEQSRGRPDEVDTRSDVFALGVILYELMTGVRPFGQRGGSVAETVHAICNVEPRRPKAIDRQLGGDLETIMLTALEKSPQRRYAGAAALGEDIERYLNRQPILVRPPSAVYLLRRLAARHRTVAALAALLAFATIAFAVIFAVQARRLAQERDRARGESQRATQINDYLERVFAAVDARSAGTDIPVRELLDRAAAGILPQLHDQPEVEASVHDLLGRSYFARVLFEPAVRHLKAACDLRTRTLGPDDRRTLSSRHMLGRALSGAKSPDGIPMLEQVLAKRRAQFGSQDVDVAESLHGLALTDWYTPEMRRGEARLREALAIRRQSLGEHQLTADTLRDLGTLLVTAGRYDDAEPMLIEAQDMYRRLTGESGFDTARMQSDLGEIQVHRQAYAKAEQCYREQVRIMRGIFGVSGSVDLSHALSDLAALVERRCDYAEAEALYREAMDMERRLNPMGTALTLHNYAWFLREMGRFAEAEKYAREAYAEWADPNRSEHPGIAYAAQNLGGIRLERGDLTEAERYLTQSRDVWMHLFDPPHPAMAVALVGLARVAEFRGDPDLAESQLRQALDIRRSRLGAAHVTTLLNEIELESLRAQHHADGALANMRRAVVRLSADAGTTDPDRAWALERLAEAEAALGEVAAAESHFTESIAMERGIARGGHPNLANGLAGLSEILAARSDMAGAESLLQEAADIRAACYGPLDSRTAETCHRLEQVRGQ